VPGQSVSLTSSDPDEKISGVADNGNGTYTATIIASETVGAPTIIATDLSNASSTPATAVLTQAPPTIAVKVKPTSITADGKSTATATVTLTGVNGEPVPGQNVTVAASGGVFAGFVADGGSGTYTATLTASHAPGTSTITATDGSVDPNVSATASLTLKKPSAKKPKKSKGPKRCTVPRLGGKSLAAARSALRHSGCAVGKVTRRRSAKVRKGKVIGASVKPGKHRKKGARIGLVVSKGR
jgi:hypothetical protein